MKVRRMRGLALVLVLASLTPLGASAQAPSAYLPGIGGMDAHLPLMSMRQTRLAGTLLQKYDFSCGSAALATLLTHHYGHPVDEATVFQAMYTHGDQAKIHREGFSLLDMKRFLASLGFEADGFVQPLDKLNEARIPAIVLINENGYHHFVVIKGVQDDRVLIGDPAQGTRVVPRQKFEAQWPSRLLFVIHNRMESARYNLAADWRVAPRAPMARSVGAGASVADITLPKLGPGDF